MASDTATTELRLHLPMKANHTFVVTPEQLRPHALDRGRWQLALSYVIDDSSGLTLVPSGYTGKKVLEERPDNQDGSIWCQAIVCDQIVNDTYTYQPCILGLIDLRRGHRLYWFPEDKLFRLPDGIQAGLVLRLRSLHNAPLNEKEPFHPSFFSMGVRLVQQEE